MAEWLSENLKKQFEESIQQSLFLNEVERREYFISKCTQEAISHVQCVAQLGWFHILANDEYRPLDIQGS